MRSIYMDIHDPASITEQFDKCTFKVFYKIIFISKVCVNKTNIKLLFKKEQVYSYIIINVLFDTIKQT